MKKTVLITGSSTGIGAGLAVAFAEAGYNIAINARTEEDAEKHGGEVLNKCLLRGADARCFVADVSNFEDCNKMVAEVVEEFGTIDVLINNAGITRDGILPRMREEDFTDVININLNSVFNMCRNVTPIMMKKRSGSIINLASVAGVYGNAGQTNYAASKAGVIGLTKSLAKELGSRGIICNAIAPGFVKSPMTDLLNDEQKTRILSAIATKRFGEVEDIAELALYLAKTTYLTGQVLIIDGGLSM